MNSNLVFDVDVDVNGTYLRDHVDGISLEKLAAAAGYDPQGDHAYVDREAGYDGWEIYGTFEGEAFNLYTRFGQLRIGGRDGLNVPGLRAALEAVTR